MKASSQVESPCQHLAWLGALLVGCWAILHATPIHATPLMAEEPRGTLMMIGGADRDNNELLWDEFVRLAGGPGATVAIFPTASSNPQRTSALFEKQFRQLGLRPFVVPASLGLPDVDGHQVVRDPVWIDRVRNASAIFLAGGEQARYRQLLVEENDHETPMLQAISQRYREGGFIAGTSAGMAVMSRIMFINAEQVLYVMKEGARLGREVDQGLGLLPDHLFVDQHFLERGRLGRALVVMQSYGFPIGIGVGEDSAAILHQGTLRVVGYRGVLVMDARQAKKDQQQPRFHWNDLKLSFLSHGDRLDLASMCVTPGPEKNDESKIDPRAPGFRPYYLLPQFYNDILGNSTVVDLMYKLVDSPHEQAVGMAFDGQEALQKNTEGFAFRFYRGQDTVSWDSPTAIGDPNTVINVYLDIRPVTILGPTIMQRP